MHQGVVRALFALLVLVCTSALAQPPGGPPGGQRPPRSPRESAQVDITGYWVALVTEDWLWRMITPKKGDVTSIPVNPNGRRVAAEWDLARDNANGEQCKAFGAAGLMRQPLRLHITWQDDNTLKIETDVGEQTRLLHFNANAAPQPPSWQGTSLAQWTKPTGGFDMRMMFGGAPPAQGPTLAGLKVVTSNLRAGYLRKNGVPYSDSTQLTEYFSRITAAGNDYLTVLSVVKDPVYLTSAFVTSSQFKREADGKNWAPSPCFTAPPANTGG